MVDLVGRTLKGRYRVEELRGEGLMGQVWRAQDTHRLWPVALKVMRPDYADDRDFLRYFEREATALTRLQHPAIVRFYSFEQDTLEDGSRVAFLVLDYIKGRDLRRRLAETSDPLPLAEVLAIARHICSALAYAHRTDLAHGDVKPANILLSEDSRAILSDFGIARLGSASSISGQPRLGTPAYMAPECWQDRPADARSDLYSFGVLLYEMLGGRRPFRGETAAVSGSVYAKLRHEHLNEPPPSLRALNPGLSQSVEAVVLKCLAKAPKQRYQSSEELLTALEAAAGVAERFTLRVNAEPSGT